MKKKIQKSIVLKWKFKNLMSILLSTVKKVIKNQINKIKSHVTCKTKPNKVQDTLKNPFNRRIKSLENNLKQLKT